MTRLPIRVRVSEDAGGESVLITNVREKLDNGVEMRLVDWTGWRDTPDIRSAPIDVPGGDGAYDDDPLKAARTVTLSGVAYAPDVATLVDQGELMGRLLIGQRRRGTVAVQIADREWWACRIRLGGSTQWKETHVGATNRATWSMSLYAADGTRYNQDRQTRSTLPYARAGGFTWPLSWPMHFGPLGSVGQITVVNAGKVPTPLQMSIAGACTNPQIRQVETGLRYALLVAMTAGQHMDIDTGAQSTLLNGIAPYGWTETPDAQYFLAPPGTSTLLFRTDSGTPTLTVSWADAKP